MSKIITYAKNIVLMIIYFGRQIWIKYIFLCSMKLKSRQSYQGYTISHDM